MSRRFIVAFSALLVCAVFAPAASASPVLTEEGKTIAAGATVTGQSEGLIYRTDFGANYQCQKSDMHGTVIKNSGSLVELEISSLSFTGVLGGKCEGPIADSLHAGNLPWCLRIGTEPGHSFTLSGGKCSEAPKPITLTTTLKLVTCHYVAETLFTGTYSTNTPGAALTTATERFKLESGPACRPFDLDPIKYNLSTAVSPFTKLTIS
jgi:hypothetical protein